MSKFLDQTGLARVRDWIKANFAAKTPFTGASSSAAGAAGLVPAPAAGDEDKVLGADGSWKTVSGGGSYSDFTGATGDTDGAHGLVPAPAATGGASTTSEYYRKYLCSDGKWRGFNTGRSASKTENSSGEIRAYVFVDSGYETGRTCSNEWYVVRKKLWENASPTSTFAAQTISLDTASIHDAGYHFILIVYAHSTTDPYLLSQLMIASAFTDGKKVALNVNAHNYNRVGGRFITGTTDTSITFSDGMYNQATANQYAIPIAVYGISL